jgi:hypothetical protein
VGYARAAGISLEATCDQGLGSYVTGSGDCSLSGVGTTDFQPGLARVETQASEGVSADLNEWVLAGSVHTEAMVGTETAPSFYGPPEVYADDSVASGSVLIELTLLPGGSGAGRLYYNLWSTTTVLSEFYPHSLTGGYTSVWGDLNADPDSDGWLDITLGVPFALQFWVSGTSQSQRYLGAESLVESGLLLAFYDADFNPVAVSEYSGGAHSPEPAVGLALLPAVALMAWAARRRRAT